MRSKYLAAIAAVSLIGAGSAAAAQTAQPLSLASSPAARASADLNGESSVDRRSAGLFVVGAIVLGLLLWGVLELTGDDEEAIPNSP